MKFRESSDVGWKVSEIGLGCWAIGSEWGDVSKEDATEFGPGDYYVNARNEIHTVWADSSTIIQITGIGPWEANFE